MENFGETPYYMMARKSDQALIDRLDAAVDSMNEEKPNWRTELYNKYYGAVEDNRTLTQEEQALLHRLQESGEPIRAVMDPDADPYSWYEDGEAHGIAADIFKAVAQKLYLPYEIVPVSTKEEYESLISSGAVDIWMDMDSCYESEGVTGYKAAEPYLTTTTSVLRGRGASDRIENLVTNDDHIVMREIVSAVWPNARLTVVDTAEQCKDMVLSGKADGALLMSYVAQRLSRDDLQNRLRVDIVPGGTVELAREAFDPAACLQESVEMLHTLSEKKDQQLTVTCDCADRVVVGDANRLKQILINIISNAIKYTHVGGHIDLHLEALPQDRYRFSCADDGIGMSEDFIQHICEDYTRAEDSRVSKIQGTGLGMSVVKGFTDVMGGTLDIKSELGKGSVFTVEIPFPPASEEERQELLRRAEKAEDDIPEYTGKKALLVEDNALNAEIAIELLKTIGLQVDWAENSEMGLQMFEQSGTDEYFAIFMDMQMPVMDGVTATKLIRQSSRPDRDIPIFAMTANTFASDRRSCREAGMTGYIPKPVSVKSIEDALAEIEE